MQGIRDRAAIVGMGCTQFGELWDKSPEDLLVDACYEAFEDAGIEPKDVQAAWLGTVNTLRQGVGLSYPLKLQFIPITRVENACCTGTDALRNACYAVAAGIYDIVLAAGVEKLKDSGYTGLPLRAELVTSEVEPPVPAPVAFATAATRYFHHYGMSYAEGKEMLAGVSVKNHRNGVLNEKAHLRKEITVEKAMNAPIVAWPLGLFDCCGVSDGSSAAIITTPEIAKSMGRDHILVKGLGVTCGALQGLQQITYDFVHFDENVTASQIAYKEAGITDPAREIDLAEVHDCFSITEVIICEDLGFCGRGKYREAQEAGTFDLNGTTPVNTDGGLKCFGHPVGASGIRMIYEVYLQLLGRAGPRQLKKADIGLTHNLGGRPGTKFTCAIGIFGRP
jgi:acetyl-CoA C-acetyltransferase